MDPTSGNVNMKTFAQIMTSIRDDMRDTGLDAFIFTDLVELQTAFSGGLQHVGRVALEGEFHALLGLGDAALWHHQLGHREGSRG